MSQCREQKVAVPLLQVRIPPVAETSNDNIQYRNYEINVNGVIKTISFPVVSSDDDYVSGLSESRLLQAQSAQSTQPQLSQEQVTQDRPSQAQLAQTQAQPTQASPRQAQPTQTPTAQDSDSRATQLQQIKQEAIRSCQRLREESETQAHPTVAQSTEVQPAQSQSSAQTQLSQSNLQRIKEEARKTTGREKPENTAVSTSGQIQVVATQAATLKQDALRTAKTGVKSANKTGPPETQSQENQVQTLNIGPSQDSYAPASSADKTKQISQLSNNDLIQSLPAHIQLLLAKGQGSKEGQSKAASTQAPPSQVTSPAHTVTVASTATTKPAPNAGCGTQLMLVNHEGKIAIPRLAPQASIQPRSGQASKGQQPPASTTQSRPRPAELAQPRQRLVRPPPKNASQALQALNQTRGKKTGFHPVQPHQPVRQPFQPIAERPPRPVVQNPSCQWGSSQPAIPLYAAHPPQAPNTNTVIIPATQLTDFIRPQSANTGQHFSSNWNGNHNYQPNVYIPPQQNSVNNSSSAFSMVFSNGVWNINQPPVPSNTNSTTWGGNVVAQQQNNNSCHQYPTNNTQQNSRNLVSGNGQMLNTNMLVQDQSMQRFPSQTMGQRQSLYPCAQTVPSTQHQNLVNSAIVTTNPVPFNLGMSWHQPLQVAQTSCFGVQAQWSGNRGAGNVASCSQASNQAQSLPSLSQAVQNLSGYISSSNQAMQGQSLPLVEGEQGGYAKQVAPTAPPGNSLLSPQHTLAQHHGLSSDIQPLQTQNTSQHGMITSEIVASQKTIQTVHSVQTDFQACNQGQTVQTLKAIQTIHTQKINPCSPLMAPASSMSSIVPVNVENSLLQATAALSSPEQQPTTSMASASCLVSPQSSIQQVVSVSETSSLNAVSSAVSSSPSDPPQGCASLKTNDAQPMTTIATSSDTNTVSVSINHNLNNSSSAKSSSNTETESPKEGNDTPDMVGENKKQCKERKPKEKNPVEPSCYQRILPKPTVVESFVVLGPNIAATTVVQPNGAVMQKTGEGNAFIVPEPLPACDVKVDEKLYDSSKVSIEKIENTPKQSSRKTNNTRKANISKGKRKKNNRKKTSKIVVKCSHPKCKRNATTNAETLKEFGIARFALVTVERLKVSSDLLSAASSYVKDLSESSDEEFVIDNDKSDKTYKPSSKPLKLSIRRRRGSCWSTDSSESSEYTESDFSSSESDDTDDSDEEEEDFDKEEDLDNVKYLGKTRGATSERSQRSLRSLSSENQLNICESVKVKRRTRNKENQQSKNEKNIQTRKGRSKKQITRASNAKYNKNEVYQSDTNDCVEQETTLTQRKSQKRSTRSKWKRIRVYNSDSSDSVERKEKIEMGKCKNVADQSKRASKRKHTEMDLNTAASSSKHARTAVEKLSKPANNSNNAKDGSDSGTESYGTDAEDAVKAASVLTEVSVDLTKIRENVSAAELDAIKQQLLAKEREVEELRKLLSNKSSEK